jgi:hypothetical protein
MGFSGSDLDEPEKKKKSTMRQEELLEEDGDAIDKILDFRVSEGWFVTVILRLQMVLIHFA